MKAPKFHAELPLGPKIEIGTAETFVWHLINRGVTVHDTKEWQKRIDAAKKLSDNKA